MAEETARLEAVVSANTRQYEAAMRALLASAQQATARASSEFTKLDQAQQQAALSAERLAQAQTRTQQATVRLAREQANLERATAQAARAQLQLQQSQERAAQGALTLTQVYRQAQAVLLTLGITRVVRETIDLSNRFRALQLGFETITGSAQASREELAFLRQESDRLGTVFLDTARGFQGIAAAARGTILEGEGAREVFLGITEAARATGRSQEEVSRALVAAQQIIGKQVVSQEELRQQLSEALPQATQTFARALGVSTAELVRMIEAGRVGLPEFLRFAQQLRTDVASGIEQVGETFQAATNRMTTGIQDLGIAFGDLITQSPLVVAAINAIGKAAQGLAKDIQEAQKVPIIAPGATLADIERLRAQVQGLPIPLAGRAGEPIPDIDELTVQRGSRAADDEAAALARLTALRRQHSNAVIGSAREQAAAILQELTKETRAQEESITKTQRAREEALQTEKRYAEQSIQLIRERVRASEEATEQLISDTNAANAALGEFAAGIALADVAAAERTTQQFLAIRLRAEQAIVQEREAYARDLAEDAREAEREAQRAAQARQQEIRESTRELVTLVGTVFDAFDLGSKKTEARIKLLLQTFSTVLQQMAQLAQQTNSTVGVGAQGQGAAGTTGQVAGAVGTVGGQAGTGTTVGNISTGLAGVTAGIGVGQSTFGFFRDASDFTPGGQFFQGVFGQERGRNISGGIAAGALGGAVAGAAIGSIIPVLGTAAGAIIGAVVGAIAGGIIAGLKKIPKLRDIEVEVARIPEAISDELGVFIDGTVSIIKRNRNVSEPLQSAFQEGVTAATQAFIDQVQAVIDIAPADVQRASQGAVNDLLNQVAAFVEQIGIGPVKDISDEIEKLVQNLTPALQAEFQDVLESLQRIGQTTQALDAAIDALEQRRDATLGGLRQQRQALQETFQSPGRVFISRQQELEQLLRQFRQAPDNEQVALVPRIQALIDEVFQLANREDVLGGDMTALLELQANLIDINKELEEASGRAFERQIDLAQQQRDALVDMVSSLDSLRNITEDQFRQANRTLQRIADFLSTETPGRFVGSFQTAPGEARLVPATGFAVVHQGETVSRGPVGNTYNSFSITVHAPPNTNAQQLSQELLSQIELRLNRNARFRQSPVSQRGN